MSNKDPPGNGSNDLGSGESSSKAPVKEEAVILATSPQSDDVFVPLLGSRRSLFPRAEDVDELRANVEVEAKSFWTEFKKFIERGPIVDLAVGSVAGGLFNKLITSFANEILVPPLGLLAGSSFRNFFIVIKKGSSGRKDYVTAADARSDGAIILGLGLFLQTLIDFIISMLFLFFALKRM